MLGSDYEHLATGRNGSLFESDVEAYAGRLRQELEGARIAVIGAAGAIGSFVVKELLRYRVGALCLFDLSENGLVELVRDLRSSALRVPDEFQALPIAMGAPEFDAFLDSEPPFDLVLNLSAMKHVRSEKDVYSIARMLSTNVVAVADLMGRLPSTCRKLFSVSSDKAVNPGNILGASKMLMERAMALRSEKVPVSTARFANVAFSDGSLLHGFLRRIEKRQPLAGPDDVRRFFMSHVEAAQLCLLSTVLGANGETFFPKPELLGGERTFGEIGVALLEVLGYEAVLTESEEEARALVSGLIAERRWPCFFSAADTAGEKPFEEFYTGAGEVDTARFRAVAVERRPPLGAEAALELEGFLEFARSSLSGSPSTKAQILDRISAVLPEFRHVGATRSLDEKM